MDEEMLNFGFFINLLVFVILLVLLFQTTKKNWSLSRRVLIGLIIGVIYGIALQYVYTTENIVLTTSIEWFNIIGNGYVALLQMIVMPLVFISILSAVAKLHSASSLGKISFLTIGILLLTTMISALIGVMVVNLFGLTSNGLVEGAKESARLVALESSYISKVSDMTVPQFILSFIPKNPFAELTGMHATSIISVVIFAAFLGAAAIRLMRDNVQKGKEVLSAIDTVQLWVMKLVRLVIALTPYGVLALMTKVAATSDWQEIVKLGLFIIASYIGLAIIFGVHAILLGLSGINPFRFFKKVMPVITFAFTSRSSAASIPMNIEAQTQRIGVPQSIAGFSASFGATIGQNGCAGLYPAMLATMIAPTLGVNPLDPMWILFLIAVVTLSSIGVAGVGGGATFAALIVLPIMGFPITLVALLISIEPLIDMGRTALNVSGSMTAGTITSQILHETDKAIFDNDDDKALSHN